VTGSPISKGVSSIQGNISSISNDDVFNSSSANGSSNLGRNSTLSNNATAAASNNVRGGSSNNVVFSEAKYQEFRGQVLIVEERTTI